MQTNDHHSKLYATIDHLMAGNKGILAADESNKSANKRLEALGLPATEETRRVWRELLFTTPNLSDFISGVILYDETIRQASSDGKKLVSVLQDQGIIPGIKVDKGLVDLNNFPNETITEGLDGLSERMAEYYDMGARFAKWRSAFTIGPDTPSEAAIQANGNVFGRYASICQANGIVPIIEPEVLYVGEHDIKTAQRITSQVLKTTLDIVKAYRVDLRGIVVKTSMVLAGNGFRPQSEPEEVAQSTLATLNNSIPSEVGAVVFLSGGQSPSQATANLNAIGKHGKQPWPITYSFSRAVQDPVMKAWAGNPSNASQSQKIFYHRLACNSAARAGEYQNSMELFQAQKS